MAAGPSELDVFVRESLLRGQSRASILQALRAAGWSAEQVEGVLDAWAEVDYPVPVPRPRASLSAREAFLHLVLFATLYYASWHLGSLLFDLIDHVLPDAAAGAGFSGPSMRWSVSSLLIAFPVFAFVARHLAGELRRHPVKRLSPVRRWLTYVTLYVAAIALICDLTTLVYNVLGGELSLRFGLKVLVVAAIAGAVFGYYLHGLRHEEQGTTGRGPGRVPMAVAAASILATIAAAIHVMGAPGAQRERRMDERRVADLGAIQQAIEAHHREHGALPDDLRTLAAKPGLGLAVVDPADGAPYDYRVDGPRAYRLCAAFATDTAADREARMAPVDRTWAHGRGRTCFARRVAPGGGARDGG